MTDRTETTIPPGLTRSEWELVLEHRKSVREKLVYNNAIADAINHLNNLADQCCGGSGTGGETYKVAAESLRTLLKSE